MTRDHDPAAPSHVTDEPAVTRTPAWEGPRYYCPRYPMYNPADGQCAWSGTDGTYIAPPDNCPSCGAKVIDRHDDPGRNHRIAVVRDEPRDLASESAQAWSDIIRAALSAPECFSPHVSTREPSTTERAAGVAVVVFLPVMHLTASQADTAIRFAAYLTAPPDAEIVAAARAEADGDAARQAVLDAAIELHEATVRRDALQGADLWLGADHLVGELTERLHKTVALLKEGRRG